MSFRVRQGPADGPVDCSSELSRLDAAISGLRRAAPELSAGTALWPWQRGALAAIVTLLIVGLAAAPRTALAIVLAALAFPFLCVVLLRAAALIRVVRHAAPAQVFPSVPRILDHELPSYTIVVALLHEAAVVPQILRALAAIDYPADKLEVLLAVEETDPDTATAILAEPLPAFMHLVVVPDAAPRTKPKAANYALTQARGDYAVVFDAEDILEPDQLRRAVQAFAGAPPGIPIGCLQARLNIYNAETSWLTRQFTIEYTALFDCILPALQALRLPVPLGGTSNHFPRRVLQAAGGWDPYNVTEDADLGIRLARLGWQVQVLPSTTWEEAPPRFSVWIRQRTRWLKGWMQTYLVHMREPARLYRELGPRGFVGLQVLMGGLILSALVHPWFYVLAGFDLWPASGPPAAGMPPDNRLWYSGLWYLGLFNLVAGYATGTALGLTAVMRRGRAGLAPHVILMPLYWLLISAAAYRALWQLSAAPYLWEKTEHSPRSAGTTAGRTEAAAPRSRPATLSQ